MDNLIKKYKSKITQLQSKRNNFELKGMSGVCVAITGEIQAYNAVLSDLKRAMEKAEQSESDCNIPHVSQQRELLLAFKNWEVDNDIKNLLPEQVVDFYIDESQ